MSQKPTGIFKKIYQIVNSIPYGQVATYGQVAQLVPISSARVVGFALASLTEADQNTPWHRVINRDGKISSRQPNDVILQRKLLMAEGVEFDNSGRVDLKTFGW
ncbi:MAG: cysteine methyltransferase [Dehalococcoidia bacterium]|nr:cysteine methyltransferase [Dehalococcoidia bacterium]MQG15766.1 cysteine methyltransferase [SAR202 cluster bacterium]|tara:strand:- start:1631 stop:1942 length:312 start_codon:yes stop_codon:yes gene_type:complete